MLTMMKHIALLCYLLTHVLCIPQNSDVILKTTANNEMLEDEPLERSTNTKTSHEPNLSNAEYPHDKLSKGIFGLDSLLSQLISPLLSIFSIIRTSDKFSDSQTSCKEGSGDHSCSSVTNDEYMSDKAPPSSFGSCGSCEEDTMNDEVGEENHGSSVSSLLDADVNLLNGGKNLPLDILEGVKGILGQGTGSENTKTNHDRTSSSPSHNSENNESPLFSDSKDSHLSSSHDDATTPTRSKDGNSLLSLDANILTLKQKLKSSTLSQISNNKKSVRKRRQESVNEDSELPYIKDSDSPGSIIDANVSILNSRNKLSNNMDPVEEKDKKQRIDWGKTDSYEEISKKKSMTNQGVVQKNSNSYNGDNSQSMFMEKLQVMENYDKREMPNKDKMYSKSSYEIIKSDNDMKNREENFKSHEKENLRKVVERRASVPDDNSSKSYANEAELETKSTRDSETNGMNSLSANKKSTEKSNGRELNVAEDFAGSHNYKDVPEEKHVEGSISKAINPSIPNNNEREFAGFAPDLSENSDSKEGSKNKDLMQSQSKYMDSITIPEVEDNERNTIDSEKDLLSNSKIISDIYQNKAKEESGSKNMESSIISSTDLLKELQNYATENVISSSLDKRLPNKGKEQGKSTNSENSAVSMTKDNDRDQKNFLFGASSSGESHTKIAEVMPDPEDSERELLNSANLISKTSHDEDIFSSKATGDIESKSMETSSVSTFKHNEIEQENRPQDFSLHSYKDEELVSNNLDSSSMLQAKGDVSELKNNKNNYNQNSHTTEESKRKVTDISITSEAENGDKELDDSKEKNSIKSTYNEDVLKNTGSSPNSRAENNNRDLNDHREYYNDNSQKENPKNTVLKPQIALVSENNNKKLGNLAENSKEISHIEEISLHTIPALMEEDNQNKLDDLTDNYSAGSDVNERNREDTSIKSVKGQGILTPNHSGRELDILGGSDSYGPHFVRTFWPYIFWPQQISFRSVLSKIPHKQSSQNTLSFKQLESPLIGRFPQSVAGSNLFGAYAYAQAPFPHQVTGYGEELGGLGEEEVVGEPVGDEEVDGEPVEEVEGS